MVDGLVSGLYETTLRSDYPELAMASGSLRHGQSMAKDGRPAPPPLPVPPVETLPRAPSSPQSYQRRNRQISTDSHSIYGTVKSPTTAPTSLSPDPSSRSPHFSSGPSRHGHMPSLPHFTDAFEGPIRIVMVGAPGCGKSSLIYKALSAEEGGWESFGGNSVLAATLLTAISKTSSPSLSTLR